MILETVRVVHRGARAVHHGGRLGPGIQPCRADDQISGDSGDIHCSIGGELSDIIPVFLKPQCEVLNELSIVETLFDDDVGHSKRKGP